MGEQFITLARVLKTQGRRGEVAVEPHTVIPDRFVVGMRLFVLDEASRRRELEIEDAWPHKGLLVLKFRGVDSISDAETLVRGELQVPLQERVTLAAGWTYISELIGCTVFDGQREIGNVEDVKLGAGEAPLLIVHAAGKMSYEIPYAQAYLASVELDAKQIHMQLPDGMLEINTPLTDEEKREKQ